MLRLIELWPATPKAYVDITVQGLSTNSRDVQQGDVFIALQVYVMMRALSSRKPLPKVRWRFCVKRAMTRS